MGSEWREMRLGDVVTLKRGYDLPKQSREPGEVPIVSSSGVSGTHSKAKVTGPGVVTGRYGTIGQVHYVDGNFWPLNTTLYVQDFKGNRPRFIKYLLETFDFHQFSDKAAVPGVNRNHLHEAMVLLPPLGEQKRIEVVLSMLECRIEILRESNVTLEAIAQALFKSWFVDFDPVRAKAEGREPEGMDVVTAALFPDEFEDSERGPIPWGWSVKRISDIATITRGRSYKSSELEESGTALVTLKSFRRGGGFRRDGFKSYTGNFKEEQVTQVGDCVVAFTDVTQQAELIGRSAIVEASSAHDRLVASLDVGIVRPAQRSITPDFLRGLLSGERYVSHIKGFVTGTTVLHLAKDGLPSYSFALPPDALIEVWCEIAQTLAQRRAVNSAKSELLSKVRDTLLPRLISGRLRLPEAEAIVEEASA